MFIDLEQFVPDKCKKCTNAPEGMDFHECAMCYAMTLLRAIEHACKNDDEELFDVAMEKYCGEILISGVIEELGEKNRSLIIEGMKAITNDVNKMFDKRMGVEAASMGRLLGTILAKQASGRVRIPIPDSPYLN